MIPYTTIPLPVPLLPTGTVPLMSTHSNTRYSVVALCGPTTASCYMGRYSTPALLLRIGGPAGHTYPCSSTEVPYRPT